MAAYGKVSKGPFKDCIAKPPAKTSSGGNTTASKGKGLPVVVGVSGLAGKASGLKPPGQD